MSATPPGSPPEHPPATPPSVTFTRHGMVAGVIGSLVLGPAVAAYGAAFGVLAGAAGLSTLEAALMSAWINAGGAQMASLQVWATPVPLLTLVLTVLAMNARYILLGAALRPTCGGLPAHQIYPSLFVLGDGNWALALREFSAGRNDAGFLLGSGVTMWAIWVGATAIGHLFGQVLSDPRTFGIDFMLAAFFATMAVGFFRASRGVGPLIVAIVVAVVIERTVPGPWYIFAGALAGSLLAAFRPGASA